MGTIDEAALTTDGLGSVDPDGTLGAQALVESSPATAAAVVAAAAAGVKVVPDPNQEEPRQRLKQAQREAKHTRLERCHRSIEPEKLRTALNSVNSKIVLIFIYRRRTRATEGDRGGLLTMVEKRYISRNSWL